MSLDKGSPAALSAGKKAAITRRINSVKNYNSTEKNRVREKIVSAFDPAGITLALESEQGLFVKSLPKATFFLFEYDAGVYKKLVEANYPNVAAIFNSDVSAARQLADVCFDQAWLDFCNSIESNIERISSLQPLLNKCHTIAITFSPRTGKKIDRLIQNYVLNIVATLRELLPEFEIEPTNGGDVYRDTTATMVTVLLKNKSWFGKHQYLPPYCDPTTGMSETERISCVRDWMENYVLNKYGKPLEAMFGVDIRPRSDYILVDSGKQRVTTYHEGTMVPMEIHSEDILIEVLTNLPTWAKNVVLDLNRRCGKNSYLGQYFCMSPVDFIVTMIMPKWNEWNDYGSSTGIGHSGVKILETTDAYREYLYSSVDKNIKNSYDGLKNEAEKITASLRNLEAKITEFEQRKKTCESNFTNTSCGAKWCAREKSLQADIRNLNAAIRFYSERLPDIKPPGET